ncbi:MAG: hypothetical protein ACTSUK_04015 [Promethearchaeota archaeon]
MFKKILVKIKSGIDKIIKFGNKIIDNTYNFLKEKSSFIADLLKKYFKLAKMLLKESLLGFYDGLKKGYEQWKGVEEEEESSSIPENEIM